MTDLNNAPSNTYFYPNRIGRVILQSMDEIMGEASVKQVLEVANLEHLNRKPAGNLAKEIPFEWVSALQAATEEVYGEKAGRSHNHKVGRNCLNTGLREFDPILGVADLPIRLMPLGMKFRVGLDVFSRLFNNFSDQVVRLSSTDKHILWIIERCPVCWGRKSETPCCQLATGILEEAIFWGTGGRRYRVEETACIAAGDENCVFQIDKRPLD